MKLDPVWWTVLTILSQIVILVPVWRISRKLGYPGWYAVILWIPFVNLAALYAVAFGETPLESVHGRLPQGLRGSPG